MQTGKRPVPKGRKVNMKSALLRGVALAVALTATSYAFADPMVGGAAMYENKNIIQNALNSKDHTTLVAAVKALTAATSVVWSFELSAFWMMFLFSYIAAPPTI